MNKYEAFTYISSRAKVRHAYCPKAITTNHAKPKAKPQKQRHESCRNGSTTNHAKLRSGAKRARHERCQAPSTKNHAGLHRRKEKEEGKFPSSSQFTPEP